MKKQWIAQVKKLLTTIIKKIRKWWLKITKILGQQWISIIVQIGVVVCLLITIIITCKNVIQQGEFNRNSLRPWIYAKMDTLSPMFIDHDGFMRFKLNLINIGSTPACSIRHYTVLNFDSSFPEYAIKEEIAKRKSPRCCFIFPDQEIRVISSQMTASRDSFDIKLISPAIVETVFVKSETLQTQQEIWDALIENDFHVHSYLEYLDANDNIYALRTTFFMKCESPDDSLIEIEVYSTYNSEKLID